MPRLVQAGPRRSFVRLISIEYSRRVVMISDPCPVVLYFPAHSSRSPAQDQQGHKVPSTRAIASLVASAASSAEGLSPAVA